MKTYGGYSIEVRSHEVWTGKGWPGTKTEKRYHVMSKHDGAPMVWYRTMGEARAWVDRKCGDRYVLSRNGWGLWVLDRRIPESSAAAPYYVAHRELPTRNWREADKIRRALNRE